MEHTLLLLVMTTGGLTLPPTSVQEMPLTPSDIQVVRSGGTASIPTISADHLNCLLTPASLKGTPAGSGCTWRTETLCEEKKEIQKIPLSSKGCEENCVTKVLSVPVVHTTQVCTIRGEKACLGPCYNCPVFCKKTQQSICETTHRVSKKVITSKGMRKEREVAKPAEECRNQEIQELCAPLNCKFVNLTKDCRETNKTVEVELRETYCNLCKTELIEVESQKNVCQEVFTDACESDPLERPWKKFCSDKQADMEKFATGKNLGSLEEKPRSQDISENKLFSFNDFHNAESSSEQALEREKQNTGKSFVQEHTTKLSEIEKELIELVKAEEELIHEEFDIIKELKTLPTNVNVNVKYNMETFQSHIPMPTPDPIIHLLETEIDIPHVHSNQSTQIKRPDTNYKTEAKTASIEPIIYSTQYTPKKQHYPTTSPTEKPNRNLSPSDFLRLCFTSGIGCDFDKNSVQQEILTTEPSTTPRQETTKRTPTPWNIKKKSTTRMQERLRERVKLCFFSNICEHKGEQSAALTAIRQPRVISAVTTKSLQKPKPKTKSRSEEIREQIQARARACFFQGKCN